MRWLRKAAAADPLAVTMSGVKLGDRVLVLGCGDPLLIAGVATKAGLTGRACALDESQERSAAAAAAVEQEGALIESFTAPWTKLPFDSDSFDAVIVRDVLPHLAPEARAECLRETWRVLRPGGRCVAVDTAPGAGLAALFTGRRANKTYAAAGGSTRALGGERFVAVRTIAERGGLVFGEGVKPNR